AAAIRLRRKWTRTVRRRRDHVNTRRRRKHGVLRPRRIRVHERTCPIEVLGIRQQMKNLRRRARLLGLGEKAVADAGLRIRFDSVGEWKKIDGVEDVEELKRVA